MNVSSAKQVKETRKFLYYFFISESKIIQSVELIEYKNSGLQKLSIPNMRIQNQIDCESAIISFTTREHIEVKDVIN